VGGPCGGLGVRCLVAFGVLLGLGSCLPARGDGPQEIVAKGTYVHAPSGAEFPEVVAEFQREKVLQYDAAGRDISVGYNVERPDRTIAATVFVYPLSGTFEDEVAQVRRAHASYSLVSDRAVPAERTGRGVGCRLVRVTYEEVFARRHGAVDSYLLVCDDPPWRFMWRVTHRPNMPLDLTDAVIALAGKTATRQ
jgi:hypothetical protein